MPRKAKAKKLDRDELKKENARLKKSTEKLEKADAAKDKQIAKLVKTADFLVERCNFLFMRWVEHACCIRFVREQHSFDGPYVSGVHDHFNKDFDSEDSQEYPNLDVTSG